MLTGRLIGGSNYVGAWLRARRSRGHSLAAAAFAKVGYSIALRSLSCSHKLWKYSIFIVGPAPITDLSLSSRFIFCGWDMTSVHFIMCSHGIHHWFYPRNVLILFYIGSLRIQIRITNWKGFWSYFSKICIQYIYKIVSVTCFMLSCFLLKYSRYPNN